MAWKRNSDYIREWYKVVALINCEHAGKSIRVPAPPQSLRSGFSRLGTQWLRKVWTAAKAAAARPEFIKKEKLRSAVSQKALRKVPEVAGAEGASSATAKLESQVKSVGASKASMVEIVKLREQHGKKIHDIERGI